MAEQLSPARQKMIEIFDKHVNAEMSEDLVHQALNPDPHKLVLFLLLGVGKILIMLRHNSGFPALIRRKITLSMGFIT